VATIKEQLAHEGFTDKEAEEIFLRAADLQNQAEQLGERMSREVLEDSAAGAGIRREFVEQAIQQWKAERTEQAARRTAQRRAGSAIAIFVVAFLAIAAFFSHRALNARLADVEVRQAQLDNVLQRRHDLIPNLIAVAKASAAQEKELIASVGRLYQDIRRTPSLEQKQALEAQLSAAVEKLMTTLRADPQTSSTAVFMRLSDEMAGAENRIAVERKRYNEAVAAYNHTARGFPVFLLRPVLGFPQQQVYFEVSEEAKQAPTF
jgi:LemA protein